MVLSFDWISKPGQPYEQTRDAEQYLSACLKDLWDAIGGAQRWHWPWAKIFRQATAALIVTSTDNDDQVIGCGFLTIVGPYAYFQDIGVHPDWHDADVHKKMMEMLMEHAPKHATCYSIVHLTDNDPWKEAYVRLGFKKTNLIEPAP